MKQIYAFALAIMLLLSSVAVYAESDNRDGIQGNLGVEDDGATTTTLEDDDHGNDGATTTTLEDETDDSKGSGREDRECKNLYYIDNENTGCDQKEFCGMYMYMGLRTFENKENCLKAKENLGRVISGINRLEQNREIAKEKIAEARQDFMEAKNRYMENKQKQIESKQRFNEKKGEVIEKCRSAETEDCKAAKEQIQVESKEYLGNIANRILDQLNKVKAAIGSNDKLTEEEASSMIADIDAQIADIEAARSTVDSAATKEEIIDAAKEMKQKWVEIEKRARLHAANTVNANLGNVAARLSQVGEKLNARIAEAKANGVDTSKIEPMVTDFNSIIASANQNYNMAQERFGAAKAAGSVDNGKVQEGINLFQAANGQLKQANAKLKQIVNELRVRNINVNLETTTTIVA